MTVGQERTLEAPQAIGGPAPVLELPRIRARPADVRGSGSRAVLGVLLGVQGAAALFGLAEVAHAEPSAPARANAAELDALVARARDLETRATTMTDDEVRVARRDLWAEYAAAGGVDVTAPDGSTPLNLATPATDPAATVERRAPEATPVEAPPAATPGATDATPGEIAGDSSLFADLFTRLSGVIDREVHRGHDFRIFRLAGDHAGIQLRGKVQLVAQDDPLLTSDPNRTARTARAAEAGEPVRWVLLGGGLYPEVAFAVGVPAGHATATAGFSAGGSLGYSVLAPYAHEAEAALTAAKNLSFGLPFSDHRARAMEEGTEVNIQGNGHVAVSTSIATGTTLVNLSHLNIGATIDSTVGVSKALDVSIRVKRLDADKVFVSVSRANTATASESVGARIGTELDVHGMLPDLGGGIVARGGEIAADVLEHQVERWLKAELRFSMTQAEIDREVFSAVLDLSSPAARAAYNDVMKLDLRKAQELWVTGDTSIRAAELEERVRVRTHGFNGNIGPLHILSRVSASTRTHGRLRSEGGRLIAVYDKLSLNDHRTDFLTDLWLGRRATVRELVSLERPGEGTRTYYHLRHTIQGDRVTSKDDVRRFLAVADGVGAILPEHEGLEHDRKFLGSFGRTDRTVDVFVTQEGLEKAAEALASPDTVMKLYSDWYERLDQPGSPYLFGNDGVMKVSPWMASDPVLRAKAIAILEDSSVRHPTEGRDQLEQEYSSLTGRLLNSDRAAYREMTDLVKHFAGLKNEPTAEGRARVLAKAERKAGLDTLHALAVLATAAGPEHVLVNELAIRARSSGDKDLVFVHEGSIRDPRAEIDARLANP